MSGTEKIDPIQDALDAWNSLNGACRSDHERMNEAIIWYEIAKKKLADARKVHFAAPSAISEGGDG